MFNQPEDVFILFTLCIPIIAIIGGVTTAIVKILSRQRQMELMQRERIAAIERGLDPEKLPRLAGLGDAELGAPGGWLSPEESARRLALRLTIGGIITLAAGIGAVVFFSVIENDGEAWAIGIIPITIALGLLASAWLVRASGRGERPPR
jgi:hypothetical protein